MFYFIDGYNLIFYFTDSKQPLLQLRKKLITHLQKAFAALKLKGMVVFDGAQRQDEGSGLSYANPLEIAYASEGQTADEYILERVEGNKKPHLITVVTNDKSLVRHVRSLGGKTESVDLFMAALKSRRVKKRAPIMEPKDTQKNIDRLLKIFEDRLENPRE